MTVAALPQSSPTYREWNRPVTPVRVAGPLYYVGPENVTSLLVTTSAGHILIDGGFEESAPLIAESIRKLGYRPEEIRVLLSTHAHTDHAGGLAALKRLSGATLYAGAADVELLARGGQRQSRDRRRQCSSEGDRHAWTYQGHDVLGLHRGRWTR